MSALFLAGPAGACDAASASNPDAIMDLMMGQHLAMAHAYCMQHKLKDAEQPKVARTPEEFFYPKTYEEGWNEPCLKIDAKMSERALMAVRAAAGMKDGK